jgi:predicted RNA-binding Zn-ribbon protein involved in translation (DUF1610 family)
MKTTQLQTLQCSSCGSTLNRIDDADSFKCKKCGEVYDLRGFSSMELDLEAFDRLLLYALKKRQVSKKHSLHS